MQHDSLMPLRDNLSIKYFHVVINHRISANYCLFYLCKSNSRVSLREVLGITCEYALFGSCLDHTVFTTAEAVILYNAPG